MILQWKEFYIHLPSFNEYLIDHVPDADGIVASPESFEIVERQPFGELAIAFVNDYYNALTEEGEAAKLSAVASNPLPSYASNEEALAAGLLVGAFYQRSGRVWVVNG